METLQRATVLSTGSWRAVSTGQTINSELDPLLHTQWQGQGDAVGLQRYPQCFFFMSLFETFRLTRSFLGCKSDAERSLLF